MEVKYVLTKKDVDKAIVFFAKWTRSRFVAQRRRRNVEGDREALSRESLWEAIVTALLTSQQRSGPQSPVNRFICTNPFPLRLECCESSRNVAALVQKTLGKYRGIRRAPTIARQIESNLGELASGGWDELLRAAGSLETRTNRPAEREAARKYAAILNGIGPKQSRNILQMLGLTRYEIPLDSRIVKWLGDFGFPVSLSSAALSDEGYYSFVEDGMHTICEAIGVLPCLMDAAIFASFDGDAWDTAKMRW